MKLSLIVLLFSACMGVQAAYAKCYESVTVDQSLSCGGTMSKRSADFSQACHLEDAAEELVEVDCGATWVNVGLQESFEQSHLGNQAWVQRYEIMSHEEACAKRNMVPGDMNGEICASGVNRPVEGDDVFEINYRYDQDGKDVVVGGGTIAEHIVRGTGTEDNLVSWNVYHCYKPGQGRGDHRSNFVVAYACKEP